jgi:hypothetical protein
MDIQWVMLAQEIKIRRNKMVDIKGIFHRYVVYRGLNDEIPLLLIYKANIAPSEANETREVSLKVKHEKNGGLITYQMLYHVPDLSTLVNGVTYIAMKADGIGFEYPGIHTFEFWVDGEYKNEESIDVSFAI